MIIWYSLKKKKMQYGKSVFGYCTQPNTHFKECQPKHVWCLGRTPPIFCCSVFENCVPTIYNVHNNTFTPGPENMNMQICRECLYS